MNHIKPEEILEVLPGVLESASVSNLVRYGSLSQSNLDMSLNEHVRTYKKVEKLLADLKDVGRVACKMTDGSAKQDLINVIRKNRPVLKLELAAGKKAMRRTSVQRWVVATATHLLEDMFWSYDKNVSPELLKMPSGVGFAPRKCTMRSVTWCKRLRLPIIINHRYSNSAPD